MSMIDDIRNTLGRLKDHGWGDLLNGFGFNLDADDLLAELLRPLAIGDQQRAIPGFEDLSPRCSRAIEPASPARSLLFHALASPGVQVRPDGTQLTAFPTARDLDIAENLVYAVRPARLDDLVAGVQGTNLAIGVFAREYRQRHGTVHGAFADMVYARTGIARVGTMEPFWDGAKRAYSPLEPTDDPFVFRTLPCRYGVYIAVQLNGDSGNFGPFRPDRTLKAARQFDRARLQTTRPDRDHSFWVPIHKLFSGTDCLAGNTLDVGIAAEHVNEKLRRIHLFNMDAPSAFDSGFGSPEIDGPPFVLRDDLAVFLDADQHGPGALNAVPRPRLIEPTTLGTAPIGMRVPAKLGRSLAASFNIRSRRIQGQPGLDVLSGSAHRAPEWLHVRTQLKADGSEENLNTRQDVKGIVERARVGTTRNYRARHYTDFTADGWVTPVVSGLPRGRLSRRVPAYSIIAAPDFYPYVSQSDVLDWSLNEVPAALRRTLWGRPPLALSDQRTAPNLALQTYGAPFRPEDVTVSAMVGHIGSAADPKPAGSAARVDRVSYLPDAAAGLYAPGWDTSTDFDVGSQTLHLAAYGLGSPFPEDAKLCAALSAFWPAVAPDTARSAGKHPIAPMTDREVGLLDAPPWDGIKGPRRVVVGGRDVLETDHFDHVDYVRVALAGGFTMAQTMQVTPDLYQGRILATHRMFLAMASEVGDDYRILSFAEADAADDAFADARAAAAALSTTAYKFVMVLPDAVDSVARDPDDPARWLLRETIRHTVEVFVDEAGTVVLRQQGGSWRLAASS